MIRVTIFFFAIITVLGLHAQEFSQFKWHKGLMVNAAGDTIRGKIKYDLERNAVQVATRQNIRVFSSHKVFYFEIFDEVLQAYRQFYSIPYQIRSNYKAPVLFELMFEGGLSLLAREKIVQETVTSGPYAPSGRFMQNVIDHDFYFLTKKGRIIYFDGTKNGLLEIFGNKRSQVKDFIKTNRLRVDEIEDLIRVTSFYNSI